MALVCAASRDSFNGAALFRARRRNTSSVCCKTFIASTGPRSFERGGNVWRCVALPEARLQRGRALSSAEARNSRLLRCKIRCFNGAALFRARRQGAAARPRPSAEASTGPRSFERGGAAGKDATIAAQAKLQRGRALSSAEASARTPDCETGYALQRGRALSSAEATIDRLTGYSVQVLQRGRALSSAEALLEHGGRLHLRHRASTGPRSFERGGEKALINEIAAAHASTGPRSFERGGLGQRTRCVCRHSTLQRGRALSSAEAPPFLP